MESERPIIMIVQFKAMLKEILEKLSLSPVRYECERFGPDHLHVFIVNIRFEDRFGSHT